MKECAATADLESEECVVALEQSGLSMEEFKAKFAAKLGYLAKAEETTLIPRWVALLLTAVAAGLVVWTLYLTYALPARHVTDHWRIAWAGWPSTRAAQAGK